MAELAALRDEDVDLSAGVISIIGKCDRQRRVYIPDTEVRDLLEIYRAVRIQRGFGTTEIYTHVADAALKSPVVERHPRKTILRRP